MLAFDTLTWVPIDRRLIAADLLDSDERAWLNTYHAEIITKISDRLSDTARAWLISATAQI